MMQMPRLRLLYLKSPTNASEEIELVIAAERPDFMGRTYFLERSVPLLLYLILWTLFTVFMNVFPSYKV